MKDTLILTDCDGVLLNYLFGFEQWAKSHGYVLAESTSHHWDFSSRYGVDDRTSQSMVLQFNESAAAGFLPPLRDAIYYVRKLHEQHGYVFRVITCFGTETHSVRLRQENLDRLFGHGVFQGVEYLPIGHCKRQALEKYRGTECWWIEDHPSNAQAGTDLGLNSVLISHNYNAGSECDAPRVSNWREIYQMITGQ
jgi:FMN phosphatase YigB (HAD superfamily)